MKVPFLLACTLAIAGSLALAQNKPKPQTPPKPKPTATAPTKGTVQLPGDNGKVGVTYQLGDKESEMHFTLESAQFASRLATAEDDIVAQAERRLLILTFTAQNPQKLDMGLTWNTFQFTVVSPDDQNFEHEGYLYGADTLKRYDANLKPAQKAKVLIALNVHEAGPVNKLIVRRGNGKVLRYDLKGLVKPASSVFANGEDFIGSASQELGKVADIGGFDVVVEQIEKLSGKVGQYEVDEDKAIFCVVASFTNRMKNPIAFGWDVYTPNLVDENGEEIPWSDDLVSMTSGQTISQELKPGQTMRGRYVFIGPKSMVPAQLTIKDQRWTKRDVVYRLPKP